MLLRATPIKKQQSVEWFIGSPQTIGIPDLTEEPATLTLNENELAPWTQHMAHGFS